MRCPTDDLCFRCVKGVWSFLLPERVAHFAQFNRDYAAVRQAEGRGATDRAYYRALPFQDLSGRFMADWRIRAASFRVFIHRVVQPMERRRAQPLRLLDVGAGNGWLSNRLAERGHTVGAIDLQVNQFDGLGAHEFYEPKFWPVQAEFDRLPFEDTQIDLIVFNASFHYSENYETTLRAVLRLLRPAGQVVILDSPIYRSRASGEQMVQERQARFQNQFGFASDALGSENFLTEERLIELAQSLRLNWRTYTPFYGWRWWLRPLVARWRGRREPARFKVLAGQQAQ